MNDNNKNDFKKFFIKLISITFAAIIGFNIIFNLIFADRLEKIDKILTLNEKENREQIKNKLRAEIKEGLQTRKPTGVLQHVECRINVVSNKKCWILDTVIDVCLGGHMHNVIYIGPNFPLETFRQRINKVIGKYLNTLVI